LRASEANTSPVKHKRWMKTKETVGKKLRYVEKEKRSCWGVC